MLARFVNSLPTALSQQITKLYFQVLIRNQRESHSTSENHQYRNMDVQVLPALKDNYMYLLVDKATNEAAIVDPVEPKTVLKAVQDQQVKLTTVLTTHHHWDHAGGNEDLARQIPGIEVYGGDHRIGALTRKVEHNTIFNLGRLMIQCLFTPCHTMGHICYYVTTPEEGTNGVVFTGDTLFLAGCGRFFEGNAEQMFNALTILGSLPDNTKVFCGHEYTLQNLKFAAHVQPNNEDVMKMIAWAQQRREEGKPTVPSTIGEEKKYNPFMRVCQPEVMQHAGAQNAIQAMKNIRLEKDSFQ